MQGRFCGSGVLLLPQRAQMSFQSREHIQIREHKLSFLRATYVSSLCRGRGGLGTPRPEADRLLHMPSTTEIDQRGVGHENRYYPVQMFPATRMSNTGRHLHGQKSGIPGLQGGQLTKRFVPVPRESAMQGDWTHGEESGCRIATGYFQMHRIGR